MKKGIFFGGFAFIWIFLLATVGANVFTVFLGILGSGIWFAIWGGIASGITDAKADMYLANKYDEEKK
jgi:hypothetical protein